MNVAEQNSPIPLYPTGFIAFYLNPNYPEENNTYLASEDNYNS